MCILNPYLEGLFLEKRFYEDKRPNFLLFCVYYVQGYIKMCKFAMHNI